MSVDTLLRIIDSLDPETTTVKMAREIHKKARKIGRCDVLPCWLVALAQKKTPVSSSPVEKSPRREEDTAFSNAHQTLEAKSSEYDIPVPVLRQVFKRGLREYARLPELPPMSAVHYAHGRVNTFASLCNGDPDARTEDLDLVNVAYRARQALS